MKTSLILITAAVLLPTSVLIGISTAVAFSTATVIGVAAMFSHDYGRNLSYQPAPALALMERALIRLAMLV